MAGLVKHKANQEGARLRALRVRLRACEQAIAHPDVCLWVRSVNKGLGEQSHNAASLAASARESCHGVQGPPYTCHGRPFSLVCDQSACEKISTQGRDGITSDAKKAEVGTLLRRVRAHFSPCASHVRRSTQAPRAHDRTRNGRRCNPGWGSPDPSKRNAATATECRSSRSAGRARPKKSPDGRQKPAMSASTPARTPRNSARCADFRRNWRPGSADVGLQASLPTNIGATEIVHCEECDAAVHGPRRLGSLVR